MDISPIKEVRSYNKNSEFKKLKEGRSCYRHLAGNIGVAFFNFLIQNHYLESENHALELTKTGEQYFESIGIDCKILFGLD